MAKRRLTSEQKDVVALCHLHGENADELAPTYGYTPGGMKALLRSKDMQMRMHQVRERLEEKVAIGRIRILEDFQNIIDTAIHIATHHSHPSCAQMNIHLQKSMGFGVEEQSKTTEHFVAVEIGRQAGDALVRAAEVLAQRPPTRIIESKFVKEGEEALPRAALGTGEQPDVRG
jgi:hypothetical protein